jgi:hypothetical protein
VTPPGGHRIVPIDRGLGRWGSPIHAGRPRISTSYPVAAASCVTDFVGSPSSAAIGARRLSTGPAAPANGFQPHDGSRADAKALGFAVRPRAPPGPSSRAKREDWRRLCPGQAARSLAVRPWPRPRRSIAVRLGRFLVLPFEIPPLPRIIVDDDCGRIAQAPTPPWPGMATPGQPRGGAHLHPIRPTAAAIGPARPWWEPYDPRRSLPPAVRRSRSDNAVRTAAVCTAGRPRSDIFDTACERAVTSASD